MKNNILACFFLFFSYFIATNADIVNAQECEWAKNAGGRGETYPSTVVTDASGNVYVTGYYNSDTMYFGASFIINSSVDNYNTYLGKYDSLGSLLWVKNFGGNISVYGMAIDVLGNIYLTGSFFSPTISFGAISLTNTNGDDIYLVKFNNAGTAIWAKDLNVYSGGGNGSQPTSITTDINNNIYISGYFSDSINFGTAILKHSTPGMGFSIFLAKFDSIGNNMWANGSNGAAEVIPSNIAVDVSGNIYITGYWGFSSSSVITFDTITLSDPFSDNYSFFLVKYNSSGNAVWANSVINYDYVVGTSLVTDASGNIIVAGGFSDPTVTFGSTVLTNADPTGNSEDIFLVKYNSAGNVIWAKSTGGVGEDGCSSIITAAAGNIYMGGMFTSPSITFGSTTLTDCGMFLAQYDSSGNPIWGKSGASISSSSVSSIVRDAFGHLYVMGSFNNRMLTLDAITLIDSTFLGPIFLAKYDIIPTGVQTIQQNNHSILIYPNPTSTSLTITSPNKITSIAISNLLGQTVFTNKYNIEQVQVDVSNLPSSIYFVKINGTEVRKFVKE